MARDKLITIRIEGEKRQAFGDLAKSQNTDTASLLYDFISGCLGGKIDISLVTGKGNRIDNQLDTNRLDKLETATQEIDNRLGIITKKLNDWVLAFDDRLTDSDQGLSEKITSLENRLNALASQLDSQRIGRIDTDSQQDRQGENPDMGTVTPEVSPSPPSPPGTDAIASINGTVESVEPNSSIETVAIEDSEKKIPLPDISIASPIETVESGSESISSIEPDKGAIGPVHGDSPHFKNQLSEAVDIGNRQGLTNTQLHEKTRVPVSTIEKWKKKIKEGKEVTPRDYPDFFKQWRLNLSDNLWCKVD